MTTGLVFNIQRYSTDDGPGIRTTVFLKGCPLSCTWCHNPEGASPLPEVLVVAERCVDCGECALVCPLAAEAVGPGIPPAPGAHLTAVGTERCLRCGKCVDACVAGARRLVGAERTPDDVLREVERDRVFYERTGGGVTFSGGEPLARGDFLLECLRACRERGLHTAVDTSGWGARDLVRAVAEAADLFLFDLKTLDPELHQKFTGVPLAPIIESLREVDAAGVPLEVRFPVIPGVTDGDANLEALARVVASLSRPVTVRLLPFHRTASDKYRRLGRSWRHDGLEPPSGGRMAEVARFLKSRGVSVSDGRD